jgi:hypothetical protein|uniref:BAG domain-containing protein n=1 Tax=viral metagenome TaxID=1070528 RepID=A0A6C0JCF1_9ZZZZ|tara:strand:- start:23 stop:310 length:288 start_codon:yes stop_codon:yes gene_type:complete
MNKTKKRVKGNNKTKKKILPLQNEFIDKYEFEFRKLKLQYKKSSKTPKDKNYFEEYSTQLLIKIDDINILGNSKLKKSRKRLINLINSSLDYSKN